MIKLRTNEVAACLRKAALNVTVSSSLKMDHSPNQCGVELDWKQIVIIVRYTGIGTLFEGFLIHKLRTVTVYNHLSFFISVSYVQNEKKIISTLCW